jgi:hypothetical protein
MGGRFLLRRSQAAREQAQRTVEASAEQIGTFIALATTLADRMEAMPSAGLTRDRERRERVDVLRRTAEAGNRTLASRRGRAPDEQGYG